MNTILTTVFVSILTMSEMNFPYLFHHYQNQFGKEYHVHEYDTKFGVFVDNVKFMFEHNHQNNTYKLGFNDFTDMTTDEFKNRFNFDSFQKRRGHCDPMVVTQAALPKDIDWRDMNAVTPVKNQEQCGSCWSFSAIGAIEGSNAITTGKLQSLSEQQLVDCSRDYGNMGCNGGLMDDAFLYAIDNGLCLEDDYPYTGKDDACTSSSCTPVVQVSKCYDVPPQDEVSLKEAVSTGPVSVAIEADTRVFQMYSTGVLTSADCGTNLDHGVLIVGYGTEDDEKYWLVKNSWGETWGEDGYIKIGRSDDSSTKGICGIAMQPSYPRV
jgi:C1A family cysteine protease